MVVSFFGHRDAIIPKEITQKLATLLEKTINGRDIVFYLGRYGNFDFAAKECCLEYKKAHKNCKLVFVSPYLNESYFKNKILNDFDEILYPNLEKCPKRFAIVNRNRWMIENSDLIFMFVYRKLGNCSKLLEYSIKKKKNLINLAEL